MCLSPPPPAVAAAAAMATTTEELQESDLELWCGSGRTEPCGCTDNDDAARGGSELRRPAVSLSSSAPVAIVIPATAVTKMKDYEEDDEEEAAAFVPPHIALEASRRRREEGRKVASSMCEGRGRTLKGRDLLSLRTAVLRMTGFIET